MPEGSGADEQIEIGHDASGGAEPAPFATKEPANLRVETNQRDAMEKPFEHRLAFLEVAGGKDAVIELGQRDDRESQIVGAKLGQSSRDLGMAASLMDGPVGVEEVLRRHSRRSERLPVTRRS